MSHSLQTLSKKSEKSDSDIYPTNSVKRVHSLTKLSLQLLIKKSSLSNRVLIVPYYTTRREGCNGYFHFISFFFFGVMVYHVLLFQCKRKKD
jgi:hypothetical protein